MDNNAVTSFGTEGRSPNVVPGSNTVIPTRTFHRSDIEELVVQQDAPAPQPAEPTYDYHVRTSMPPVSSLQSRAKWRPKYLRA